MIAGSRCPICERASVPAEPRCLTCGGATRAASFEPAGEALARTTRPGKEAWTVLVELGGGARVLAVSPEAPALGARVQLATSGEGMFRVTGPR